MPIWRGDVQAEQPISFEQFSGAITKIADLILELTFYSRRFCNVIAIEMFCN